MPRNRRQHRCTATWRMCSCVGRAPHCASEAGAPVNLTLVMTRTFLRLFSRDRQAIFFSLFFPLVFMTVFGLAGSRADDPMKIGIVDNADNALSHRFIATLSANPLFEV